MAKLGTCVILNPVAGHGRARRVWEQARPELERKGLALEIRPTTRQGHAVELARQAVAEGFGRLIAVGGDGTVNEVINGLMTAPAGAGRPALGVLPAGSGNDFSRNIGLSRSLPQVVEALAGQHQRRIDLGLVNGRYFGNVAGMGFDAEVARMANRLPKFIPGTVTYLGLVPALIATYRPCPVTLTLDGQRLRERILLAAVGNGVQLAGGMKLCPGAVMDDGLFEVVVAGPIGRLATLRLLPTVYSGAHVRSPWVRVYAARRVRIEAERPLAIQADGEIVGETVGEFEVAPQALSVLVPPAVALRALGAGRDGHTSAVELAGDPRHGGYAAGEVAVSAEPPTRPPAGRRHEQGRRLDG